MRIVEGQTDDVLNASDAVVTASGTATVQTALHGKPMVVLYKLSPMTYRLGKALARVDMYAMVNLIAGERVVLELIQDACTGDAVAAEAVKLLTDTGYRERMSGKIAEVRSPAWRPRRQRARRRCGTPCHTLEACCVIVAIVVMLPRGDRAGRRRDRGAAQLRRARQRIDHRGVRARVGCARASGPTIGAASTAS